MVLELMASRPLFLVGYKILLLSIGVLVSCSWWKDSRQGKDTVAIVL